MESLHYIKIIIEIIAVIIMLWGLIVSLVSFAKNEVKTKDKFDRMINIENIRGFLATYILLGLELFIVADIIQIIISPTTDDLIVLVVIVVVRTLMSYFLEKDYRSTLSEIFKNKKV